MTMLRDPEKTVGNMLDKQRLCYIGSVDEEGYPNIKCMLRPRLREGIRTIYFSTNTSSMRVEQYRKNAKASIYVCDGHFFRGAMLKGHIEVLEDPELKARLWESGDDRYYPLGVTDPDYCILRFTAVSGRYYGDMKSQSFSV